jgi:D-xylose transport system ATP-binding protein
MSETQLSERAPILEVRHLSKTYGAVRALRDVGFVLHAGEVIGLVGDNGAGKSTLINLLAGSIKPDTGEIVVDGVSHAFKDPSHARKEGIETVYQYLSLIPTLDMAENVYLGRELYAPIPGARLFHWMDKRTMRREVEKGFSGLGLQLPSSKTKVAALSGGQRQAVAIARAVLWGSHIVLLDEPTAALGVKQTEIVLSFIERLKSHAVGVIFISHNMPQVLRVADRIVVLRLGRKVFDGPRSQVSGEQLVALMTGVTAGAVA